MLDFQPPNLSHPSYILSPLPLSCVSYILWFLFIIQPPIRRLLDKKISVGWVRSVHIQACRQLSRSVTQQDVSDGWRCWISNHQISATHPLLSHIPLSCRGFLLSSNVTSNVDKLLFSVLKDDMGFSQIKYHFDLALRAGLQGLGWIGAMDQTRPTIPCPCIRGFYPLNPIS
jgi:hypothetical protein